MINELAKKIHSDNVRKGFYEVEKNVGEIIALIHSEASEMLECHRKGQIYKGDLSIVKGIKDDGEYFTTFESEVKDTMQDELADIIIRCLDFAGYKEIDIENHIMAKLRFNRLRSHKHGKKY